MKLYLTKTKLSDIDRHLFNITIELMNTPDKFLIEINKDVSFYLKNKYGNYKIKVYNNCINIGYYKDISYNYTYYDIKFKWYSKEYILLNKMFKYCYNYYKNIEKNKHYDILINNLPKEDQKNFRRNKKLKRVLN